MLAQPFCISPGDVNRMALGILPGEIHCGGDGARNGNKALHLPGFPVPRFQPCGKFPHVIVSAAGERAYEIWKYELLLARGIR